MWMDGYDKYLNGIRNRINSYSYMDIDQQSGLASLKQWLYNHNQSGSSSGGLGVFQKRLDSETSLGEITEPGPYYLDKYIQDWSTTSLSHFMTIVGYDDNVPCGSYGNGALKVANSWDEEWGNSGFVWLPYGLATQEELRVYYINEVDYREPQMVVKVRMKHQCRNKINVGVYVTIEPDEDPPSVIQLYHRYNAMNPEMISWIPGSGGGCKNLDGSNDNYESINFVFDISEEIQNISQTYPELKIILGIEENDTGGEYSGMVEDFSIIDYRGYQDGFEVYSHDKDIDIVNNGMTNLTVWYFQLPPQINQQTGSEWDHPCIVKESSTIESGTIADIHGDYLDFYDDGNLTVENGAALNLYDNIIVSTQRDDEALLNVLGSLNVASGTRFTRRNFSCLTTILIDNTSGSGIYQFEDIGFKGVVLDCTADELIVKDDCKFENSIVDFKYGDLELNENDFDNSTVKVSNQEIGKVSYIYNNNFTDPYSTSGSGSDIISFDGSKEFTIELNEIYNRKGHGIRLENSGMQDGTKLVTQNTIEYNGPQPNNEAGIYIYNSHAEILNNKKIKGFPFGIQSLNNSQVSIKGYKLAHSLSETQCIMDNTINQIYAVYGAVPYYCHWNAIIDEDNNYELYKILWNEGDCNMADARWNYWGINFDPVTDLSTGIRWYPVWQLLGGSIVIYADEQMYNTATELINNQQYTEARDTLKQLVTTYPDSLFAQVALKELFVIGDKDGGNYDSLKHYYETDTTILNDSTLNQLANFLVTLIEVETENYATAIDRYDSVIQNPPSYEDSLFAIIDLAHTYLLAQQNGYKAGYTGKFPQYKFDNRADYDKCHKYHISLLHNKNSNVLPPIQDNLSSESKYMLRNYPNPFTSSTSIEFVLGDETFSAEVLIFDCLGKTIKSFELRATQKGINQINIDLTSLNKGMYYYALVIDDNIVETNKMVKL